MCGDLFKICYCNSILHELCVLCGFCGNAGFDLDCDKPII
jgi:hypothetical protein